MQTIYALVLNSFVAENGSYVVQDDGKFTKMYSLADRDIPDGAVKVTPHEFAEIAAERIVKGSRVERYLAYRLADIESGRLI